MLNGEAEKKLMRSSAMRVFYRVLATIHSNAIHRVMVRGGSNPNEIIRLAREETFHLIEAEAKIHKCPPGTMWDEVAGECVRITETVE